jgi:rubrerythrin
MTKSLKGTKTELNLCKSFAGESQARNRYEFFASEGGQLLKPMILF